MGQLAGLKVLVVEDEALIGLDLIRFLEDLGCSPCGPFASRDQALNSMSEEMPDIATLDVNLSHGDTCAPIAEALQRASRPFVYVTANEADVVHLAMLPSKVVLKPINYIELERTLAKVVRWQKAARIAEQVTRTAEEAVASARIRKRIGTTGTFGRTAQERALW